MEVIKNVSQSVVDKLKSEAERELQAEFEDKAKKRIKDKLRDFELAKRVVTNIQRELDDLYVELSE